MQTGLIWKQQHNQVHWQGSATYEIVKAHQGKVNKNSESVNPNWNKSKTMRRQRWVKRQKDRKKYGLEAQQHLNVTALKLNLATFNFIYNLSWTI